ncbi:MAG: hypothetical protein AB1641_07845 [Thermodesulfobacteriota bacterium]
MISGRISFRELSATAKSVPALAQIFVHYDPGTSPLSKIVELIERFEMPIRSVEVCDSEGAGLKIAVFRLEARDVSHVVIAVIENLGLEAFGCGPIIPDS